MEQPPNLLYTILSRYKQKESVPQKGRQKTQKIVMDILTVTLT